MVYVKLPGKVRTSDMLRMIREGYHDIRQGFHPVVKITIVTPINQIDCTY